MSDPPVRWDERLRRFVVTGHRAVVAVLQDPAAYSSRVAPQVPAGDRELLAGFTQWSARWLFFLDPPEHTARRAPVAKSLAPRALPPVEHHATELAAQLPTAFDAVADFAHPLAARVIAEVLGDTGAGFFARARAMERASADARDPAARRAGLEAIAAAVTALRSTVDDVTGAHSLMLMFAGIETTQNLIANTLHALLTHPGTWDSALPAAVEEGARYAPPVRGVLRRTTRAVVLAGVAIPAGAELVALTAAANRDPAVFTHPDRFDPARRPNRHLTFGLGRHYCPGAELTRRTTVAALAALRARHPGLRLTGPAPRWRDHDPLVHAPVSLPVTGAGQG
ncbi:cytochrome P450 [Dactylosporangium vinaceum]|uniref:Cytochrome P450 n=1 Tax=Dactylosporangium vinaceum TaxID=53362 RepID=A0ABV5M5V4_9ACTN|nr:cytochrome P450 [Dactylosporangium vinaceum]UAC01265.1 cytochrome P450 [Dactylosporangium vinaceum]